MKKIENIIIHCSDSNWGSSAEIDKWHRQKGWSGIGYHFVICNGQIRPNFILESMDGMIEVGRQLDGDDWIEQNEIGAHTLGYNDKSIGICLIGKNQFTEGQLMSLISLVEELKEHFNIEDNKILGHYETEKANGKTCPNFDVSEIRKILNGSDIISLDEKFISFENMFN